MIHYMFGNIQIFKDKKDTLKKRNTTLIVADFDGTIFCRKEQLERYGILKKNRQNKGNKIIKEKIGIDTFIQTCYQGKEFPQDIVSKMDKNQDLILTAGYEDIQTKKIKATGLQQFPLRIVFEAKEKPFEMTKYIVEELQYIPKEIHIYEDRPEHFITAKKEIADFLGTKIKIFIVEMEDNKSPPHIKEYK